MRNDSNTVIILLATVGLTESDQLWALTRPADDSAAAKATAHLANTAVMALIAINDAERLADQALISIASHAAEQRETAAKGYRRNADWLVQAAEECQAQIAVIDSRCQEFRTAAYPLAVLLGLAAIETAETAV